MKVYIEGHLVGEGFFGKLIGRFTWGRYKHVSMIFEEDNGHRRGFQSNSKRGVHFYDWVPLENVHTFLVPCNDEQAYSMLNAAKGFAGQKYDYKGLFGFLVRRNVQNPVKQFCSEVASRVCKAGGVILQRLPAWKQSPTLVCASVAIEPEVER